VIPVIDLKGGIAVHAVRGQRDRYGPLRSVLVDSADPLAVARALRARLSLEELYVADLDAIEARQPPDSTIAALAREVRVILDAGTGDVETANSVDRLGVDGVVIGTETLDDPRALARIRTTLADVRVVLSLDVRAGRVVSRAPQLSGLAPAEALEKLTDGRPEEAIVLDLARVGTAAGPDIGLIAELHGRFPALRLLAGGGVRDARDLLALRAHGAAGALVATAVHTGAIGPAELAALRQPV
jgi:phosphoribosylformimino-5-aminoimidazole carboxamide ribotide isomerase